MNVNKIEKNLKDWKLSVDESIWHRCQLQRALLNSKFFSQRNFGWEFLNYLKKGEAQLGLLAIFLIVVSSFWLVTAENKGGKAVNFSSTEINLAEDEDFKNISSKNKYNNLQIETASINWENYN